MIPKEGDSCNIPSTTETTPRIWILCVCRVVGEIEFIGDGGGLVAIGEELMGDSVMKTRCAFAYCYDKYIAQGLRQINHILARIFSIV